MRTCLLLALLAIVGVSYAQQKQVRGKISGEDGNPIPSATVQIKGTTTGTSANQLGDFQLTVPDNNAVLIFRSLGYAGREITIGNSTVLNVVLTSDNRNLTEVVVTALGIKREKKALGYAVQEVKGSDLTIARSADINNSLAGKVAGVKLQGSPSSSFDNADIIIRGINGLMVGNPLYVIDGTPSDPSNVIMDNVESVTVLKGPGATALYGQRAANGVVVVTTKKGKRNTRSSVEVNIGVAFENLSIIPKYQNQYGGGSGTSKYFASKDNLWTNFKFNGTIHPAAWAAFDGQKMLDYSSDESWGPKMDGSPYRAYWSWYPGDEFGKTTPLTAQPNNVKDFYRTGVNANNSIAFNTSGDNFNFRLSYANINRTLVLPNAKRNQHQVGISGNYDVNKRLSISTDMAFTTHNTTGQPFETYRNDHLNVSMEFNQWFQRQLDMKRLKNYRQPDGTPNSWNIGDPNASGDLKNVLKPPYWENPYFVVNENFQTSTQNKLVGNVGFNYKFSDVFSWQSFARMNYNQGKNDARFATGSVHLDEYSVTQLFSKEMNYETQLNFRKKFGAISLDGFVGGNIRKQSYSLNRATTQGGLTSPNYFNIAASRAKPDLQDTSNLKEVRSLYGKLSLGYKEFLFVDGTLRNDWSSALPVNDNSYLYPSITGSFVFTQLMEGNIRNVLSFGKVRASYAQVGSDLDPYRVNIGLDNGGVYAGDPSVQWGDEYRSGRIRPALTRAYEFGAEFKLFNRFGIDFSYYTNNSTDQILSVDVSPTSGFSKAQINAGNIQSKGWELSLSATPVKTKSVHWDITVNFARNTSIVKSLSDGLNTYLFGTATPDVRLENRVGEEWGKFIGRKWKTDPKTGKPIILANGLPDYTIGNEYGSLLPKFTGGMYNTISWKNIDLAFSLDFQSGGLFYSSTKRFNYGSGLAAETVGINDRGKDWRDTQANGGGLRFDGVNAAGQPNAVYIDARNYFYNGLTRHAGFYILDASYLKLREVRLGYRVPNTKFFGSDVVKNMSVGLTVSNAWLIAAPAKKYGVDPSELEEIWKEGGQLSATRQIGFNIKVGF